MEPNWPLFGLESVLLRVEVPKTKDKRAPDKESYS